MKNFLLFLLDCIFTCCIYGSAAAYGLNIGLDGGHGWTVLTLFFAVFFAFFVFSVVFYFLSVFVDWLIAKVKKPHSQA